MIQIVVAGQGVTSSAKQHSQLHRTTHIPEVFTVRNAIRKDSEEKPWTLSDSGCQWLKCNGTQGNAVPPPPICGLKRSPTSECYNATERHTTIVMGPNLNVAFPHL